MNESHIRNVIEAALLAAGKPLQPAELVQLFDEGAQPQVAEIQAALTTLAAEYSNRGIEIKETAAGYRIQVRRELANEISRLWPERPARYSRALLETLALIAYRQPITRAEIEAVRGVAVNPNIIKTVIERNWVRVVGTRDVPGRPELLGTTRDFLDYFGLKNLDELPPLAELKTLGDIKVQFDLPDPGPIGLLGGEGGVAGQDAVGVAQDAGVAQGAGVAQDVGDGQHAGGHEGVAQSAVAGQAIGTDQDADGAEGVAVARLDAAEADTDAGREADASGEVAIDVSEADALLSGGGGEVAEREDEPAAAVVAVAHVTGDEVVTVEVTGIDDASSNGIATAAEQVTRARSSAAPDSALYEAEEFAASIDAELASGDDDGSDDGTDEDELSAAGPTSGELVAGPRDWDE
jgi:segregation and condensation protein B